MVQTVESPKHCKSINKNSALQASKVWCVINIT